MRLTVALNLLHVNNHRLFQVRVKSVARVTCKCQIFIKLYIPLLYFESTQ